MEQRLQLKCPMARQQVSEVSWYKHICTLYEMRETLKKWRVHSPSKGGGCYPA